MSDERIPDQQQAAPSGPASDRSASVRLRTGADQSGDLASQMDPANQSLADALKITFVGLQAAMVLLAVLFVASGFTTVDEGETGIGVRFGRQVESTLNPGLRWTLPYPFGELVRVPKGTEEASVDRAFIPFVEPGSEDVDNDRLPSRRELDPTRDGSNITGDLNLAHTQWTVNYRRDNHAAWAENIDPGPDFAVERLLVQNAVQRGVVHALAETSIDDLLKDAGQLAPRVRDIAQQTLAEANSGIVIDQVILRRKIAPVSLLGDFAKVNNAQQEASKARENAQLEANQLLNAVAGQAARVLSERIDRYEEAVELGRAEEAELILAQIDRLLEGRRVEIDGQVHEMLVSGEVSEILSRARNQAFRTVETAKAGAQLFEAKLAQFEANPDAMLSREWADAFSTFASKPFVEAFVISGEEGGRTLELLLNSDPDTANDIIREQQRRRAEEANLDRERRLQQDRFNSNRGVARPDDM